MEIEIEVRSFLAHGGSPADLRRMIERVALEMGHDEALPFDMSDDVAATFAAYIKTGPECWEWQGGKNRQGYGSFRGRNAQRTAWELLHGEIESVRFVCHSCDNPGCVRPSHLFLGSHLDNMADMKKKGRGPHIPSSARSPLTEKQAIEIIKLRGSVSSNELGKRYGVHRNSILRIWKGMRWKYLQATAAQPRTTEKISSGVRVLATRRVS